jgi:L-ribulose-5-phosphate 4-epimerase
MPDGQTAILPMMVEPALREEVCRAHHRLAEAGLVALSWGNASARDPDSGAIVIKPSGIACDALEPDDLVVVSIEDGTVQEGRMRPSSDTPTHLELYRRFPSIGGVVHTHSRYATAWAQSGRDLPCFGTTHADHFRGSVPVSRAMTDAEIDGAYESETGRLIADTVVAHAGDASRIPAVLVRSHGPFTWGHDANDAVDNAVALEQVAVIALWTLALAPDASPVGEALLRRHFDRKHGPAAYYGQAGRGAGRRSGHGPSDVRPARGNRRS